MAHSAPEVPSSETCKPAPVVSLGSLTSLAASSFGKPKPGGGESWANTPEGEWTVEAAAEAEEALRGSLRLGDGTVCSLASISVYRPTANELALRLNYGACVLHDSPQSIVVAVEVGLRQAGSDGASGLLDWMCELLPKEACGERGNGASGAIGTIGTIGTSDASGASGDGRRLAAVYDSLKLVKLGAGRCQASGDAPVPHPKASDVQQCAELCKKEAAASGSGGSTCRGFSFSSAEALHCLLHKNTPSSSNYVPHDTWQCYAAPKEQSAYRKLRKAGQGNHSGQPSSGSGGPELRLQRELGNVGHRGIRWQVVPLVPKCFPPLQWISLGEGGEAALDLGPESWDLLVRNLPVAEKLSDADGTLASDRVCVEVRADVSAKSMCGMVMTSSDKFQPWEYLVTMMASASVAALATFGIMRSFVLPSSAISDEQKANEQKADEQKADEQKGGAAAKGPSGAAGAGADGQPGADARAADQVSPKSGESEFSLGGSP